MSLLQSIPIASRRETLFRLSTAGGSGVTGQTFSGSEIQVCKAGATSLVDFAGSVAEIGNGLYKYTFTTGEIDTPGILTVRINKSGAIVVEYPEEVLQAVFGTAATGTLTTTAFSSSRTEANNVWRDALVRFETGALAGQVKKIGSFSNTGGIFTLASGLAFTAAPSNGDVFRVLNG